MHLLEGNLLAIDNIELTWQHLSASTFLSVEPKQVNYYLEIQKER